MGAQAASRLPQMGITPHTISVLGTHPKEAMTGAAVAIYGKGAVELALKLIRDPKARVQAMNIVRCNLIPKGNELFRKLGYDLTTAPLVSQAYLTDYIGNILKYLG